MDPAGLPQQSLVNTVPHIMMVHWYLLGIQGENFRIWPKSGLTFWRHIILMSDIFIVTKQLVKGCKRWGLLPLECLERPNYRAVNTNNKPYLFHFMVSYRWSKKRVCPFKYVQLCTEIRLGTYCSSSPPPLCCIWNMIHEPYLPKKIN